MRRSLENALREDLESRIVLLSGPRQVGKTTLSKMLYEHFDYLNHDFADHRLAIKERSWDRAKDLVILDELHKMRSWKGWLKGVFDVEGARPRLLVTGSARLDLVRKMGDSLAGRFFAHRLHPFDLKELRGQMAADEALATLLRVGGFPEPLLNGTQRFHGRWRRSQLDIVLRQDLVDIEAVRDIQSIETLVELLRRRVGSTVSMSSLARDLERDPKTIKRWVALLENLYVIFRVTPYHRSIARSLLKEPKFYFFDVALVEDPAARLENVVACSLRKELDHLEDTAGTRCALHYLRTKEGKELDFAICLEHDVVLLLEVKSSEASPSPSFKHFGKFLPSARRVQLTASLERERTFPGGVEVRRLARFLSELNLEAPVGEAR